jgi:phenylglyoxylate dehydrogenase epsilon subunit
MKQTHYLIVGASHAALAALHAIRMVDTEHDITVLGKDDGLPYSPTVLPYVVSGRTDAQRVFLRDGDYFRQHRVDYLSGCELTGIAPERSVARLADGEELAYAKLLLATGAAPVLPAIDGLQDATFRVLRTLDDALRLRQALPATRQAVVLGAGLIGMHAAENFAEAGTSVTVVEMQSHVLPGYFDADAGELIRKSFAAHGVRILTGSRVELVRRAGTGCLLTLAGGHELAADLLLIGTGVRPVTDYLQGAGVELDRGILVDEAMRTSVANIWAAGDVAQARSFYGDERIINGILPDAVEQGRIAGQAMAGDPGLKPYAGGVPLNTYSFFGQTALSVGVDRLPECGACEEFRQVDEERGRYLKIVLSENRLIGIFAINVPFDAGVMWELILRRIDLSPVKSRFIERPQETARLLMSRTWR